MAAPRRVHLRHRGVVAEQALAGCAVVAVSQLAEPVEAVARPVGCWFLNWLWYGRGVGGGVSACCTDGGGGTSGAGVGVGAGWHVRYRGRAAPSPALRPL